MENNKFEIGRHPSFRLQFDKLTRAYIKGEVNPYSACSCFVGNLLNNKYEWKWGYEQSLKCTNEESGGLYTLKEMLYLEEIFMSYVREYPSNRIWENPTPEMEEILFTAFEDTLEELKKVHISKGEVIEETPQFKKRKYELLNDRK